MRLKSPRIEPLDAEALPAELAERLKSRASIGEVLHIYRTLAHDPEAMKAFLEWGGYILSKRSGLAPREREIVILRTGWLCKSGYEWTQHERIGRKAGLNDAEIVGIKQGAAAAVWSEADRALIKAADELHADQFITSATWAELEKHFDQKQRTDLIFTAGQYTLVSMFLNSVGVQVEASQSLDPDLEAYE
jgi:4-carboxymuconolactone decarboxylase